MKRTSWSTGMSVTGDGGAVIAHAGSIGLRMLAENTGLTGALSTAMARRSFIPSVHDRGQVLTDVAVMLADGGEAISDIDVLRHQGQVLGPVASAPTVWRALDEVTDARRRKIQAARARVRRHVWAQLTAAGGVPASKVAGTDLGSTVVLDVDATIVIAHSEKELAAPTFKRTFGFHPLGVWCDNTQEFLAAKLRTGRAGSNTATDHIEVLTEAIAQVPGTHRRDLLIRSDGAGASHLGPGHSAPQDHAAPAQSAYVAEAVWSDEASRELRKIPFFVRGKARRNWFGDGAHASLGMLDSQRRSDAHGHRAVFEEVVPRPAQLHSRQQPQRIRYG